MQSCKIRSEIRSTSKSVQTTTVSTTQQDFEQCQTKTLAKQKKKSSVVIKTQATKSQDKTGAVCKGFTQSRTPAILKALETFAPVPKRRLYTHIETTGTEHRPPKTPTFNQPLQDRTGHFSCLTSAIVVCYASRLWVITGALGVFVQPWTPVAKQRVKRYHCSVFGLAWQGIEPTTFQSEGRLSITEPHRPIGKAVKKTSAVSHDLSVTKWTIEWNEGVFPTDSKGNAHDLDGPMALGRMQSLSPPLDLIRTAGSGCQRVLEKDCTPWQGICLKFPTQPPNWQGVRWFPGQKEALTGV